MEGFIDTINWCGLWDTGFSRPKFTLIYQNFDGTQIRERFYRALGSMDWCSRFPTAKLVHLTLVASDHSPLSLHMNPRSRKRKMGKVICFESMWLKDPRCEDVVRDAWEEGLVANQEYVLGICLENGKARLETWNKEEFGHVGRKIAELQKYLKWLELQPASPIRI